MSLFSRRESRLWLPIAAGSAASTLKRDDDVFLRLLLATCVYLCVFFACGRQRTISSALALVLPLWRSPEWRTASHPGVPRWAGAVLSKRSQSKGERRHRALQ
ncbi:hypothetical protein L915_01240 [Phytophthora nicotianae]|uniref:Uncharacterized protein n=1 Tax=Phytophthora nicotianae TaxID=4792 RepID=W2HKQ0_PHYNI|nr:hypothetical protein L915_01240 [Phytophthora nicotianae]